MAGEITLKELSPQLRERIENCQGGSGGSINADIKTCGFIAEKDQTTFTIPYENYIAEECYLDVKVNSIWVSPDEYTINGKEVIFNTALEADTEVFFTVYLLGTTAVSSVNANVVIENENRKFVTSQEKNKISIIDNKADKTHTHDDKADKIHTHTEYGLKTDVTKLQQTALLSKGDNNNDANTIVSGITRNTTGSTNYPSSYGIMATLNSNETSGNYMLQLHAGTSTGYLHYRTGADNKITKPWTRLVTGEEIEQCVRNYTIYKSGSLTETERDPNTILDSSFLTSHPNTPTGNFWFIRNYVYGSGTSVTQDRPRTQVAIPYRYENQGIYTRSFDGSAWTKWLRVGGTSQGSIAFVNGWSISPSYGYTQAERTDNVVSLNIVLSTGNTGGNITIGTLPVGYRPKKLIIVRCAYYMSEALCNLVIEPTGVIRTSTSIPPTIAGEIIVNTSYIVS